MTLAMVTFLSSAATVESCSMVSGPEREMRANLRRMSGEQSPQRTRRSSPKPERSRPRVTKRATPLGRVVFSRSGSWWVAELPAFPGGYSQGRTQIEAYRNLLNAIRDLVDTYAEQASKANFATDIKTFALPRARQSSKTATGR